MPASETGGEDLRPTAGIDRLIHEPARLMIMAYLYVARERRLPLPDAPDRGLRLAISPRIRASLRLPGTSRSREEFVDRKPHTMLRLTGAGRGAFRAYRVRMMQVLL